MVCCAHIDHPARVVDPVRDHRPTIVLALLNDIELIASSRAIFDFPEATSIIEREAFLGCVLLSPKFQEGHLADR